jgi:hypothetical protein
MAPELSIGEVGLVEGVPHDHINVVKKLHIILSQRWLGRPARGRLETRGRLLARGDQLAKCRRHLTGGRCQLTRGSSQLTRSGFRRQQEQKAQHHHYWHFMGRQNEFYWSVDILVCFIGDLAPFFSRKVF